MMNGMYGIGPAMMIFSAVASVAVLTLVVLGIVWLARDLGTGKRRGRPARCVPQPWPPSAERR